jgi:plasmid stabilization system protein ParE
LFGQKRALKRFTQGADFVEEQWGEQVREAFIVRTFSTIDLINAFPEIGILENSLKGIRSFHMPPYHRLYYRTSESKLFILNMFDQRMDPKKLRL